MAAVQSNPHGAVRPDWLARQREDIFQRGWAIVDAHHHLWDRAYYPYPVDRFVDDASDGHDIRASVYVESHARYHTEGDEDLRPVGETEFARESARIASVDLLAPQSVLRPCAGIVGHADLRGKRVPAVLEAHLEAGGGRFRGVRQITAWHADPAIKGTAESPPPGLLSDPSFRNGFAQLQRYGLSFDAWLYFTQLDELYDLAAAFPDTPVVIDHVGGVLGIGPYAQPNAGSLTSAREPVFSVWRTAIEKLAMLPNVYVKLSGLGMRIVGLNFEAHPEPPSSEQLAESFQPYFDICIQAFGPSRCMFASNFPVDKAAFSYRTLWNAHKRIASRFSDAEARNLLHDTATNVYRLQESRSAPENA